MRPFGCAAGSSVPPWFTFPQAPLSSRTVGFPESGWQPVMCGYYHSAAFPYARKLKCTLTYTPHAHGSLCR